MLADKYDGLNKEIIEIETKIDHEKEGTDLENALTEREEALKDLEALYENNLSSITGQLIIEMLKKESGEQNRSKVFKKANEYFNRITRGRYELKLEERDSPEFKSYDTILKLGQDLRELSTGTRIQLLLSVRLAFIETQETAMRLPILADELLANSDDIRTEAIIKAIGEISKEGRQVFYFTAQSEEVAKWKTYLGENPDISSKIIELNGRSNESIPYHKTLPDFPAINMTPNIPEPGDRSYDEYGKNLQVRSFDLLTEEPEQLHLWFLLDENGPLYKCMLQGIAFYGQMDSFISHGGIIEGIDKSRLASVRYKVKFLTRFQELYRKGRSYPINKDALMQSGAVSNTFIDAVSDLLKELKGDPVNLVAALHGGEVPGFRGNKTNALEEYLYSNRYISEEEPLETESIVIQLEAYLSSLELPISEAENFINRILDWN